MTEHPKQWRTLVKGAAALYDKEAQARHVASVGAKPGRGDAQLDPDAPVEHICYDCGRVFKAQKGLTMHRVRAH
eukprot:4939654-Alexandrium_andersonii.AAC.1